MVQGNGQGAGAGQLLPAHLGLPPKFDRYWPGQEKYAFDLTTSPNRFSFLEAPTGSGKSLIYSSVAKLMGTRALVLVGTKGLQNQLMADFEAAGMLDVRGQSNYPCIAFEGALAKYGDPGDTCEEGPCHAGIRCSLRDNGCLYYDAQTKASHAEMVVTNYAYWMSMGRHADPMALGEFGLLILDEAHTAPEWLTGFCAVELERSNVRSLIGIELPSIDEGVRVWSEWALGAMALVDLKGVAIKTQIEQGGAGQRGLLKILLRLTKLKGDLQELIKAGQWRTMDGPRRDLVGPGTRTDWIVEPLIRRRIPVGARLTPVWGHAYAEQYLFRGIPKIVLASATLPPVVGARLGLTAKTPVSRFEVPSSFAPARRPFIWIPTCRVDRNMVEGHKRQWISRIDSILETRLDRRGIIHTRSYDRAEEILRRSKYSAYMLVHDSHNTKEVIAAFKNRKTGILVSPSIEEGFDFPDDECRFQIIAKVPFIDGRGLLTKARTRLDPKYPNDVAALALVQMYGRGMRSATDWCETYIIDDHWSWFRRATPFPKWFRQSWRVSDVVPPPFPIAGPSPVAPAYGSSKGRHIASLTGRQ